MKIETLEVFCKVVEEGSISQVAKNRFISQPAITRQIRQLEESYKTLLFERNKGNLVITKEGEALFELAKEIVNKYNYSFDIINEIKGKYNNSLSIGSSLTIGEYLLPSLLGIFKKNNPDTNIKLDITNTPRILQSLKSDKINIALVEGEVDDSQFITKKFAEDELVIVCSSTNPRWSHQDYISIQDLANEKIIGREEASGTRKIIEKLLFKNNKLANINMYMELGSTEAIKKAVEIDLGIAILSKLAVQKELKNGSLKRIFIKGKQMQRNLWIVRKQRDFYRAIEEEFSNFILKDNK